ncbi:MULTISPECIES: hypothetical protein [unclassified Streptomyces]|uniref:hypothetical protein n=1 Tax=unclassified Streptomyces TaxID=2593676 RepID=UPI00136DC6F6|nr:MULTISPECIES: hypothetical protein [unclassified Streptomyces]MYZ36202.1 hypothetical protein [Streptomyces sp. SID4917]
METIGFIVSAGPLAFDLKSTAHRDSDRVQPYEANGGDDDDDDGEPNPPTGDGDDGRQY